MQNSFYFLYDMPTLWSSEVNEAFLEQVKVAEQDYDYIMLQFFKKEKLCTQNKFTFIWNYYFLYIWNLSGIIWKNYLKKFIKNHLYLFIICTIYWESSSKIFSSS